MATTDDSARSFTFQQGDLCHMEVPIEDGERAKKFYGEVFGWRFQHIPELNYTLFSTAGSPIGGGLSSPDETPIKAPLVYLTVASIEKTAERIEAFGGKSLSPKIEVPGQGWFMQVRDSEGNTIAIWESK